MSSLQRVTVACHDAGAANIIMAEEMEFGFPADFYCLAGPAFVKWQDNVPAEKVCSDLEFALQNSDMLKSGTGWSSDFEHKAREIAKAGGIKSVAVIDHWVNYPERFIRNGKIIYPDEIQVADEYAYEIARTTFEDIPVIQKENYYLTQAMRRIHHTVPERRKEILYVLEPIRAQWCSVREEAGEFQALDYFKTFLRDKFREPYTAIRLRPHPSESAEKYQEWIEKNADLPVILDSYDDIEEAIANADWIFGCESYGLVMGLYCQKPVYCTIPAWAPPPRLPHKGLKQLRNLL